MQYNIPISDKRRDNGLGIWNEGRKEGAVNYGFLIKMEELINCVRVLIDCVY